MRICARADYSVNAAIDEHRIWTIGPSVLATHVALRYLPSAKQVAFWRSGPWAEIGALFAAPQPLRGFGEGCFTDRNLFSLTAEIRQSKVTIRRAVVDRSVCVCKSTYGVSNTMLLVSCSGDWDADAFGVEVSR